MSKQRLQKLLADAGYFSRRSAEAAIRQGRVRINQNTAHIGDKAYIDDAVFLDGRCLDLKRNSADIEVIAMNKAAGLICSRKDPQKRRSVFTLLPKGKRWVMVGRLDINTSGLLLFTTNGELANRLMHPSYQVEREYAVRVLGEVTEQHLQKLTQGIRFTDGLIRFVRIKPAGGSGANRWYHVVLKDGKNRAVRRLWEALGFRVSRLIRIRYGEITLPLKLRANQTIPLNEKQIRKLGGLCDLKLIA